MGRAGRRRGFAGQTARRDLVVIRYGNRRTVRRPERLTRSRVIRYRTRRAVHDRERSTGSRRPIRCRACSRPAGACREQAAGRRVPALRRAPRRAAAHAALVDRRRGRWGGRPPRRSPPPHGRRSSDHVMPACGTTRSLDSRGELSRGLDAKCLPYGPNSSRLSAGTAPAEASTRNDRPTVRTRRGLPAARTERHARPDRRPLAADRPAPHVPPTPERSAGTGPPPAGGSTQTDRSTATTVEATAHRPPPTAHRRVGS
jgi:hypothetical protein